MNSIGSEKRTRVRRIFIAIFILILFLPVSTLAQRFIRVGLDCSQPPFSFVDQDSNSIRGFNVDLIKMLVATLGAKIKFFSLERDQLAEYLIDGKIDLMICEKTETHPNLQTLDLPIHVERKLFVNNCCITVTCVRDLPGRTLVTLKGSHLTQLIPQPERVKLIEVDQQEEALQLVNSGKAEVYLSPNGLSAIYSIQKNNLRNIKEVGIPVEAVPLAIWVRQDNMPLLTELSVAFGKITENKSYDTIYRKWFGQNIPFAYFEKYFKIILGAIGFFAIALLGFFIYNQMLKRKVRKVTHDLQLSEQKHKDLIEFSPEMIHLISPNGRIVHANKIALQMLGYTKEEMTLKRIQDLVPPESQKEVEAFIHSIFQTGSGKKEFAFCGNGGRQIDVEMSATLVKGMDTLLACCFSRDMTEHKRLEAELMQSERLALMGEMAAGIAHEINNPLGIILANTEELLQNTKHLNDYRESLETIERNALRAGKFIEDLLTFTRPSPPAKVQIDLLSLIDESLSLCKQQLKQKRIHLSREFPENPIFFEGDDNQIQQLVVNLLLNSIQAISEEGIIRIRVRQKQDNGTEKIHLEIADTGMGIPEKDLPRIFDPFFTARKNKGFGLGLSISKRIVEKHNGTIHVESKVGHGTVIFIDLPTSPIPNLAEKMARV